MAASLGPKGDAIMTRMMQAGLASLLLLAAAAPAQAEIWCLKSFGNANGACVFPSGRECAAAARMSAYGGVCERQSLPQAIPDRRATSRKDTGRW
jgi:hypothetical protein